MAKIDAATMYSILERYLPLLEFLEKETGYGSYIVKMHGKRPVKLWRLSTAQTFESKNTLDDFVDTKSGGI